MAKLHDDWSEFLKLLNARRAKFLVVGAHAVAAAGRPRLTADLDLWVEPTLANARRVVNALTDFGFGGLAPEKLTEPDVVVFLGRGAAAPHDRLFPKNRPPLQPKFRRLTPRIRTCSN